jgi:hypothetical protein
MVQRERMTLRHWLGIERVAPDEPSDMVSVASAQEGLDGVKPDRPT